MSNILLIEPDYPRAIPPLGLMKISTYEKSRGSTVRYWNKDPWDFHEFVPDLIYITSSIFSWYVPESIWTINRAKQRFPGSRILTGGVMASQNPEHFEKETGIKPHRGPLWHVEGFRPDYEEFHWTSSSLLFTTRGCWVGCDFCTVPIIEGRQVRMIEGWRSHVDLKRKILVLQDNNFTAAPWDHFCDVTDFIKDYGFRVDLNSGIEPHSFTEKHAQEMKGIEWRPIRTAFDELKEEKQFEKAMELIRIYLSSNYRNVMVYCLFNFKDTPEEALYRANRIIALGGSPWPMPFRPLDWFSKDPYISPNWSLEQIRKFYRYFSRAAIWKSKDPGRQGIASLKDVFEYVRK